MPDMNRHTPRVAVSLLGGALATALAVFALPTARTNAEETHVLPPPAVDEQPTAARETVVLAGGCFWGVQGVFQHVDGVMSATSGYAGGAKADAHYQIVSGGDTGHAESVEVVFDPHRVSLGRLLQIYFSVAHDPTELNRQGPDYGTQYRSAIFPQTEEQTKVAKAYIAQLNHSGSFGEAVVTKVEPGKTFYPAEAYHQNFLTNHPTYPYIVINDLPKVQSLKAMFPTDYRPDPVLVAASEK